MALTLNQFLFLVITICIVVAVAFLIALIVQLRKTAREGEDTLVEIRDLIENLRETDQKVKTKLDDLTPVIEATKTTAARISDIAWFLTTRVIKPSSKYWPYLFPLLRFGWRHIKKKGGKNGKR
jgi:predicted PurR-regulated permease PerM